MLLFFGSSNYGKTDHLPGLFYVKTKFYHLWWLPLLPVQSIIYVDDGTETMGADVGFRWKSVATAWLRTIAGFVIVALTISLITGTVLADEAAPGRLMPMDILGSIGFSALMVGLYYGTILWSRPGYRRAMKLADEIGFPPEVVKNHFPLESAFEPTSTCPAHPRQFETRQNLVPKQQVPPATAADLLRAESVSAGSIDERPRSWHSRQGMNTVPMTQDPPPSTSRKHNRRID